jgi:hypothetical protein
MTDAERNWLQDVQRYRQLIRTMDRLGVLADIYNYIHYIPISESKYGEQALLKSRSAAKGDMPYYGLMLAAIAADIKAGTVSLSAVAAIMRTQVLWAGGFPASKAIDLVDDFLRSYRYNIHQNYLYSPAGVCYEPSQGGHAP